jgi:hypothetical protein
MTADFTPLGVLAAVFLFGGIAAIRWTSGSWTVVAVASMGVGVILFSVFAWLQLRKGS